MLDRRLLADRLLSLSPSGALSHCLLARTASDETSSQSDWASLVLSVSTFVIYVCVLCLFNLEFIEPLGWVD